MRCPYCHCDSNKVLESRSTEKGQSVRRRRECLECNHRFTTYERIEFIPITVIKKDNNKESFDRSKLLRGIVRACEKTGIKVEILESLVDDIESQIQEMPSRIITSQHLGELVLEQLKIISEVAYIRFASVYGQFTGIEEFVLTLQDLESQHRINENPSQIEMNLSESISESSSQLLI